MHAEERLDEVVPGLEPLRVRDLIRVDGSDDETVLRFITRNAEAVRASSSGVVLNTFEAIEGRELAKIRRELSGRPAFAVGPLHLASSPATAVGDGRGQFKHAPDRSCLAWLDARPPRSVLYVSMGSVARVDRAVRRRRGRWRAAACRSCGCSAAAPSSAAAAPAWTRRTRRCRRSRRSSTRR